MSVLTRGLKAVYNFLVGDMRILIGTLVTLLIVWLVVRVSPAGAGALFFLLLALTLSLSLRREVEP